MNLWIRIKGKIAEVSDAWPAPSDSFPLSGTELSEKQRGGIKALRKSGYTVKVNVKETKDGNN